jgi:hypothetical protein
MRANIRLTQGAFRRKVLVVGILGLLLGLATSPAWALAPGVPPIIREATV